MIPELVNKLRTVRGVSVNVGMSIGGVEAFQKRSGVQLPDELKTFYQLADGISSTSLRTETDIATARKLLASVRREGIVAVERSDACSFASWLFGEEQIPEAAGLLESEDEYTRRQVCERLKAFQTRRASEILRDYSRRIDAFVKSCAELLSKAGIRNRIHQNTDLQVLDGSFWLNIHSFYSQRARVDFDEFFVERVRHLMEQSRIPN
jgi:hypothetical protein